MFNLFITFLKIGLFTFGGGYSSIPLIAEKLEQFNIDYYQFTDFIAIAESTPGPFAVNIATFIGYHNYGILGAIVATLGIILPSFIIMMVIVLIINKIRKTHFFKNFLKISTPIILGLILSSTLKITTTNLFNISSFSTMKEDFKVNNLTLLTSIILIFITLIYYKIKKERLAPLKIISTSFIFGLLAYIINLI